MSDKDKDVPIGNWTIDILHYHLTILLDERRNQILAIVNERSKQLDERFNSQQMALQRSIDELNQYKASSNEWRGVLDDSNKNMASRVEWEADRLATREKLELLQKTNNDRHLEMERRLSILESRSGYVSTGFIMSALALIMALGMGLVKFVHI